MKSIKFLTTAILMAITVSIFSCDSPRSHYRVPAVDSPKRSRADSVLNMKVAPLSDSAKDAEIRKWQRDMDTTPLDTTWGPHTHSIPND